MSGAGRNPGRLRAVSFALAALAVLLVGATLASDRLRLDERLADQGWFGQTLARLFSDANSWRGLFGRLGQYSDYRIFFPIAILLFAFSETFRIRTRAGDVSLGLALWVPITLFGGPLAGTILSVAGWGGVAIFRRVREGGPATVSLFNASMYVLMTYGASFAFVAWGGTPGHVVLADIGTAEQLAMFALGAFLANDLVGLIGYWAIHGKIRGADFALFVGLDLATYLLLIPIGVFVTLVYTEFHLGIRSLLVCSLGLFCLNVATFLVFREGVSLRLRLTASAIGTMVVALTLVGLVPIVVDKRGLETDQARQLADMQEMLGLVASAAVHMGRTSDLEAVLDRLRIPGLQYVKIESGSGTLVERELREQRRGEKLRQKLIPVQDASGTNVAHVSIRFSTAVIDDVARRRVQLLLGAEIVAILGMVGVMFLVFQRTVLHPVQALVQVMSDAEAGNLAVRTRSTGSDEFGRVGRSFDNMLSGITRVFGKVTEVAQEVARASGEFVSTSKEISSGMEAQAQAAEGSSASMAQIAASIRQVAASTQELDHAVEEMSSTVNELSASINEVATNMESLAISVIDTYSSIEEMTVSIQEVAKSAQESNRSAKAAAEEAKEGGRAVALTVDGMRRVQSTIDQTTVAIEALGVRSGEIGTVVELIDDIAEQTNLLALNAAIEAARAGEHGRGFAVVAEEVRKLAERTAASTREIASAVRAIQDECRRAVESARAGSGTARDGMEVAARAGETLQRIVSAVSEVTQLMNAIAIATNEQSRGSEQIVRAVENMNMMTQQVTLATKEQAQGTQQVMRAIAAVKERSQQVAGSTEEERRSGELVVQAVENISRITSQTSAALKQMVRSSEGLNEQAERLQAMVRGFRLLGGPGGGRSRHV